ncbi:MAG: hypothetical protein OQK55_05810, partial [Thermoanaerobaculales bacterium]|nr:hypothetical protein [Thermoanaerobaculales bacterium]
MDHLISPHGSHLVNLVVDHERAAEIREESRDWLSVDLGPRQLCDLELLINGGYSPLDGYLGAADHRSVCSEMRLANGVFWPIPVTLSHDKKLDPGTEITLLSGETDEIMGTMKVTESYQIDKDFECSHVYATTDEEHPGVKMVKG